MLVFVTGAAGFIGRTVAQEFLDNDHQVLGLARSDAFIETITKAGAEPHRLPLKDIESLQSGAKAADGVIHLALKLPVESRCLGEAVDAIVSFGHLIDLNNPTSSERAQREMGWHPFSSILSFLQTSKRTTSLKRDERKVGLLRESDLVGWH